jgi:hypothetical protein
MTPETWYSSLLRNGLVTRFPQKMNMHATLEEPVSKHRIRKHTTIEILLETVFSIGFMDSCYIESVQLRVETPTVKRSLYMCCSAVMFGVCGYSETVIVPVLKSVTRKRLVQTVTD